MRSAGIGQASFEFIPGVTTTPQPRNLMGEDVLTYDAAFCDDRFTTLVYRAFSYSRVVHCDWTYSKGNAIGRA